ncbi:MAG: TerB family tellurite resistance protein [Victivallales bacterium]
MNISFLPEKVKSEFTSVIDKVPLFAARTNGNISGEPGEGYVVACGERLFIYSRKAGEDAFLKLAGKLGAEISNLDVRKDKFNSFLEINLDGNPYSLKFSSAEMKDLESLVEKFKTAKPAAPVVPEPPRPVPPVAEQEKHDIQMPPGIQVPERRPEGNCPLTPMQFMAAALMYVSASDGSIDKDEDSYILRVFPGDNNVLQAALQFYKSHSAEQLFDFSSCLNDEQKVCILANMVEIAMRDESYHRVEQIMIRSYMEKAGISKDNLKAISSVLLVKNNLSVLMQ